MYTKEEICKNVENDMKGLGLNKARILNGDNYYFSEGENRIILHFALIYQKGEIEKLKLKYTQEYGTQFSCLSIRKKGDLNEVDFEFIH